MTKLNDLQSLLLSAASQRDTGSLLPLPEGYASDGPGIAKAITGLLRTKRIEQRDVEDAASIWRTDGEASSGLFITPAGLSAIGIDDAAIGSDDIIAPVTPATPAVSKIASVLGLLQRADGATLSDIIALTGWLPHTTRAALTGLRKKGHAIERGTRDGVACYHIASDAA